MVILRSSAKGKEPVQIAEDNTGPSSIRRNSSTGSKSRSRDSTEPDEELCEESLEELEEKQAQLAEAIRRRQEALRIEEESRRSLIGATHRRLDFLTKLEEVTIDLLDLTELIEESPAPTTDLEVRVLDDLIARRRMLEDKLDSLKRKIELAESLEEVKRKGRIQ